MTSLLTTRERPDILRWMPARWDQIIGNRHLKRFFQKLLRRIRKQIAAGETPDLSRLCLLISGESRSGKSMTVKLFVRCLTCEALNPETGDPCDGTCGRCRDRPHLYGLEGLHSAMTTPEGTTPVQLSIIDSTRIAGPAELREMLVRCHSQLEGIRVLFFDEIHRLIDKSMDSMLLKAVEDLNYFWIFATAKPEGLEDMFLNRLTKLRTERPTIPEMAGWTADRCEEWKIDYEAEAVVRLVEKSNRTVGLALHALVLASLNDGGLTVDLVENDWEPKVA